MLTLPLLLAAAGASTDYQPIAAGAILAQIAVILLLVGLNGFFVASEFAIVKVRSTQLEAVSGKGKRKVKLAMSILDKMDAYLSVTQLGITLSSIALGMLGEPFIAKLLQNGIHSLGLWDVMHSGLDWMLNVPGLGHMLQSFGMTGADAGVHAIAIIIAYIIISYLHIVWGELMPKSLAIRYALGTTLTISRPLHFFYVILKPAIYILNGNANFILRRVFRVQPASEHEMGHSEEELRHILTGGERTKTVTPIEKDLLLSVMDFDTFTAREIMTPRQKVVCLDSNKTFLENLEIVKETGHTRFPLVDGHIDQALGIVHVKDILKLVGNERANLKEVMRDFFPVYESTPVDKLLKSFKERRVHMALVVDEYGGAVGIVTLENVLEEIVGEIRDEFDTDEKEENFFKRINDDEFEVDGAQNLYDFAKDSGMDLESDTVATIGGYITQMLERLPIKGEEVDVLNYHVTVLETDGKRLNRLKFVKTGPVIDENGDEEEEDDDEEPKAITNGKTSSNAE